MQTYAFLLAFGGMIPLGAESADLIAEITAAHRQNAESIRTLHTVMVFHYPPDRPPLGFASIEWWQTDRAIRCVAISQSGDRFDQLFVDGTKKSLQTAHREKSKPFHMGLLGPDPHETMYSPWNFALIKERDQRVLRSQALLDSKPKRAEVRRDNNRYVATYPPDPSGNLRTTSFDPSSNCTVTAEDWKYGNGKGNRAEVKRIKEVKPGIFFPLEVVTTTDEGQVSQHVTFTRIDINEPIPSSVFALAFPDGTSVTNTFTKQVYQSGADEQPANTPSPLVEATPETIDMRYPTGDPRGKSFAQRNWQWLTGATALVIATLMGAAYVLRKRNRERS